MYKLSILIAVYNDEQYLEECMDSLLSSTRQSVMYNAIHNNEVEILITNDHDNKDKEFIDIINKIKNKYTLPEDSIKYYINKENQGLLLNQCDMILKANGEYITFIDPDDHYNDNVYGEVFSVLNYTDINKKPELVICNANVRYFENLHCEHLPFLWTRFYLNSVIKDVINIILSFDLNLKSFQISNDILINDILYSKLNPKKITKLNNLYLVNHDVSRNYINYSSPKTISQAEKTIANFINMYTITKKLYEKQNISKTIFESLSTNLRQQLHRFLLTSNLNMTDIHKICAQNNIFIEILKKYKLYDKFIFSICVTFYNKFKYVKTCLDSIINQNLNYNFIQIILVNDCSTDNTDEEINKYINEHKDLNIKYIKHKENMGVFEARRTCINNADGEYTIFVDGDDEFVENRFDCWVESTFINSNVGKIDLYPTGRNLHYSMTNPKHNATKDFESFFDRQPFLNNKLCVKNSDEYLHLTQIMNDRNGNGSWRIFSFITGHVIKTELCYSILQNLKERYINFNYSEDSCLMRLLINKAKFVHINIRPYNIFYCYNDFLVNSDSLVGKTFLNIHINKSILKEQVLTEFSAMITAFNITRKYCTNYDMSSYYENEFMNSMYNVVLRLLICKKEKEIRIFLKTLFKMCRNTPELKKAAIKVINNQVKFPPIVEAVARNYQRLYKKGIIM